MAKTTSLSHGYTPVFEVKYSNFNRAIELWNAFSKASTNGSNISMQEFMELVSYIRPIPDGNDEAFEELVCIVSNGLLNKLMHSRSIRLRRHDALEHQVIVNSTRASIREHWPEVTNVEDCNKDELAQTFYTFLIRELEASKITANYSTRRLYIITAHFLVLVGLTNFNWDYGIAPSDNELHDWVRRNLERIRK